MTVTRHANRNNPSARKGKRNQRSVVADRWEKKEGQGRVVDDKFLAAAEEKLNKSPLRPMNQQQAEYIHLCRNKPYVLAYGYAGSSKTYIPTRVAIEKYLKGEIDTIVIVRPAVSESKSLGYFGGDLITKMRNWVSNVLDIMDEFLGKTRVDYMLTHGHIKPVPLETIKGRSFADSFIIVDEAEDMTKSEIKKCITRLGSNSTMVFAGDLLQKDIKVDSGLEFALDLADDSELGEFWGVVGFDEHDDIVRSRPVKKTIIRLTEMGEM